ncbi:MAG: hypothetical protein IJB49_02315 [Clostridia bacterium]|nr:hypothetical protein [Clostridia bacterium]
MKKLLFLLALILCVLLCSCGERCNNYQFELRFECESDAARFEKRLESLDISINSIENGIYSVESTVAYTNEELSLLIENYDVYAVDENKNTILLRENVEKTVFTNNGLEIGVSEHLYQQFKDKDAENEIYLIVDGEEFAISAYYFKSNTITLTVPNEDSSPLIKAAIAFSSDSLEGTVDVIQVFSAICDEEKWFFDDWFD